MCAKASGQTTQNGLGGGNSETPDTPLTEMQSMDHYEFEHFVAAVWGHKGYESSVTQQSGDMGLDVRAVRSDGEKHMIQAKRYGPQTKVGSEDVQKAAALWRYEVSVTEVYIVTTGSYTDQARQAAKRFEITLLNGDELVEWVRDIKDRSGGDVVLLDSLVEAQPGDGPTYRSGHTVYTIPENSWTDELLYITAGGTCVLLGIASILGALTALFYAEYALVIFLVVLIALFVYGYTETRKALLPREQTDAS